MNRSTWNVVHALSVLALLTGFALVALGTSEPDWALFTVGFALLLVGVAIGISSLARPQT